MSRRAGVTLVEVLVAIFVMGIGLIALLTLFPIGMLRMARAIHDERTRQAALNAHSVATAYDLRDDPDVRTASWPPIPVAQRPPWFVVPAQGGPSICPEDGGPNNDVFANPWPANPAMKTADPYGESYSILVDPIGYYNSPANGISRNWVGGVPTAIGVLRRRPINFVAKGAIGANNAQKIVDRNRRIGTAFTLWDDMVFNANLTAGNPGTPTTIGTIVLRDPRFSWGYTMRRPQTSDRSVVDCSIVVFDKRSLSITGNGSLSEYVYPDITYFDPIKNTITIDYTSPTVVPPPVRAGDWIFDATPYNPTPNTGAAHGYWYRVVATEELLIAGSKFSRYEVQQPIRGVGTFPGFKNSVAPLVHPTFGYRGTAVVLDGVADVFDKGPARLP